MTILSRILKKKHTSKQIELDVIRKNLQNLGCKFMNGISQDTDIHEWIFYLSLLKEEVVKNPNNNSLVYFTDGIDEVFCDYLLIHYPDNDRLRLKYENKEVLISARKSIYRKMLIIALGEALFIVHKWEFENKEKYQKFILAINEYVYTIDNSRERIYETEKCMKCSEEKLVELIKEFKVNILDYTKEQKVWHKKIDMLHTFKI